MKIFVFTDVLADYGPGIAIIAAESLEQAQEVALAEFGRDWLPEPDTLKTFLDYESGFKTADAEYETTSVTEPKLLHYLRGSA